MSRINLITAPDRLYNANISILLINPSETVKADFNRAILNLNKEIHKYRLIKKHLSIIPKYENI
jgi:hypothetical protein